LLKCLDTHFPDEPRVVETICILGAPPRPQDQAQENINLLKEYDARYVTYDTLIKESLESYGEYLGKEGEITEILEIIESI